MLGNGLNFRTMNSEIKSRNRTARAAGILYVLLVICGLVYLVYVPGQLIVWDDAATTLSNIRNSPSLFKLGIFIALCSFLIFTLLPLVLYRLLSKVHRNAAILMVLFSIISVPISFVNILNKFTVLDLIEKSNASNVTTLGLQNEVMLCFENYSNGLEVLQIFWGLWLLPFGYLVYKSGFLPKVLGVFLMAGCFGYLITFVGGFLIQDFSKTTLSSVASFPAATGEIGIALWLLIMGTNRMNFRKL